MADQCPKGGDHEDGTPGRVGNQTQIKCTKCGEVLAAGELPDED